MSWYRNPQYHVRLKNPVVAFSPTDELQAKAAEGGQAEATPADERRQAEEQPEQTKPESKQEPAYRASSSGCAVRGRVTLRSVPLARQLLALLRARRVRAHPPRYHLLNDYDYDYFACFDYAVQPDYIDYHTLNDALGITDNTKLH